MASRTKLPTEHEGFHRGVFYAVRKDEASGLWHYLFSIGDTAKAGKIEARLGLLAVRRVRSLIDRALGAAPEAAD